MASCYFAVFPNCIPNGDYIREAVARGWFRDEWLPKYRYQVACGAAESGCVKIFREARLLSHISMLYQVNCHSNVWNYIVSQMMQYDSDQIDQLILHRVKHGWKLTGLYIHHNMTYYPGFDATLQIIRESRASGIVESTIQWLYFRVSYHQLAAVICQFDTPDLVQFAADNWPAMLIVAHQYITPDGTPKLHQWMRDHKYI
jgi:hypothetical protein